MLAEATVGSDRSALIKLSVESHIGRNLLRQGRMLRLLHRRPDLQTLTPLLPKPMLAGIQDGWAFLVESRLPGRRPDVPDRPGADDSDEAMIEHAFTLIGTLHTATERQTAVDDWHLERWIVQRSHVASELARAHLGGKSDRRLQQLTDKLGEAILGQTVKTAWIHGDYWPGNLVVDDADTIVGIVDWDSLRGHELPLYDLLHFAVTARRLRLGQPWGTVLLDLLIASHSGTRPGGIWARAYESAAPLDVRQALLMYWLWGVASNLSRHPAASRTAAWVQQNVGSVLWSLP